MPPDAAASESDAIQLSSKFDPARSSPTTSEELPLPAPAVPHATVEDAWSVPDAAYEELVAWYRFQLPEGRPWRDWDWCELKVIGDEGDTTQWLWSKPPNRILSLVVVDDDPPGVLIGPPDDSGPC